MLFCRGLPRKSRVNDKLTRMSISKLKFTFDVPFFIIEVMKILSSIVYLTVVWEVFLWTFLALIVVGVIGFLLFKFVFVGRNAKKQFNDLSKRYDNARSTLLNKDTQHLRRIESISDVNLLIKPVYEKFYRRFTDLREIDDRRAQKVIQVLNEALIKGVKDFRKIYPENRNIILDYEAKVNKLDEDLTNVILPESESREKSVVDKEKFRQLKILYRENKFELTLVEDSFNKIFDKIEELFVDYDNALNGAYYEEANNTLTKIQAMLKEVEKALDVLPLLCVKATNLLPNKINDLVTRYEQMEKDGYPLQNLLIRQNVETFNEQLNYIYKRLKMFQTANVDQTLNEIDMKINELFDRMDFEVTQKELFDNEFEESYRKVNETEHKYIWLVNMMPKIKAVYLISEEKEQELVYIKDALDEMSNSKRNLDNFIHSATKQPYSVLDEYMEIMQDETQKVETLIDEYVNFVNLLKEDSEHAFTLIKDTANRFKMSEMLVRDLNVYALTDEVAPRFDHGYTLIDEIHDLLKKTPIDVDAVREKAGELSELAESLVEYVDQQVSFAHLSEKAILKLNQYRNKMNDIKLLGDEVERLFYGAQFEEAYNRTIEPLARFKK